MRNSSLSLIILLLGSLPSYGDSFDRPVTTIKTDEEGIYHAGFMHWATIHSLFSLPAELVVLGEVESITQIQQQSSYIEGDKWIGRVRVDEVVVCPDSLRVS